MKRTEAKREIRDLADAAIRAVWLETFGEPPAEDRIRWHGIEEPETPGDGYWTRTKIRTLVETRAMVGVVSLGDATAATYENIGDICIQVCGSKDETDAMNVADGFAEALKARFNELVSDGAIWFTECRVKDDLPMEADVYQVQMWADWKVEEERTVRTG